MSENKQKRFGMADFKKWHTDDADVPTRIFTDKIRGNLRFQRSPRYPRANVPSKFCKLPKDLLPLFAILESIEKVRLYTKGFSGASEFWRTEEQIRFITRQSIFYKQLAFNHFS